MDLVHYILDTLDTLVPETVDHLQVVGVAMAISVATGLTLGIAASRFERLGQAVLGIPSTLLTIPSFALLSVLTTLFIAVRLPIGDPPVIAPLVLYAPLPIMRTTRAGILAVNPGVREAARGMGMTRLQVLTRVELPLAVPVILGGVRQATVMIVAIATVGAAVGSNNLGRPIVDTLQRSGNRLPILAGILLVAAIGISADAILGGIQGALSRGRMTSEPIT